MTNENSLRYYKKGASVLKNALTTKIIHPENIKPYHIKSSGSSFQQKFAYKTASILLLPYCHMVSQTRQRLIVSWPQTVQRGRILGHINVVYEAALLLTLLLD